MLDPIKSTFGICDENNNGKLTMNEIHQDNCLDTLEKVFGLNKSVLNEVCSQIDTNNDMMISFEEASIAFHRSDFGDRSEGESSEEESSEDEYSTQWEVTEKKNFSDNEVDIAKSVAHNVHSNTDYTSFRARANAFSKLLSDKLGGFYHCWWLNFHNGNWGWYGNTVFTSKVIQLENTEDHTGPYCYTVKKC